MKLLRQLRPAYSPGGILRVVERAREKGGYRIACVESAGDILCVAGFVIGFKLAWGKHLYVDDLVTTGDRRSKGAGSAMIEWLKTHALENGCTQLHLDSSVTRHRAHRFYLRHGFDITSHHFAISDLDT